MLKRKRKKAEIEASEKIRQFVGFKIGEELYGVDIHSVEEIDRMHAITKLPKTLEFVEGVINLRGKIIPVMDMPKRFGLPPTKPERNTRIIISRIEGQSVGLIVEQVSEVIQLPENAIDPAPSMAFAVDQKYVAGVGKIGEELIIVIDLNRLLSVDEMTQLQQHAQA